MALTTNFNQDPYYDDFDDDKNYHRILFKPGNAVQARELTQLQTTLQDQIKKFGDHVFKNGSVVTGGDVVIQNSAYLNVASTYGGQDIAHLNFDKQTIINTANTKRAYVLKSYASEPGAGEPITLIINQLYGDAFDVNETFYTSNTDPSAVTYYATTASTNAVGNCQSFSVDSGVFYYDGFFVKTSPQTVAINKYDRQSNGIIGFTVSEDLIDYTEDTTLLDPAQGSSNFQAPGSDRYKVSLTLDTRPTDSTDLTKFIELMSVQGGAPQKTVSTPIYGKFAEELARRTADESGDYVINDFKLELSDNVSNSAFITVSLGAGKAYLKGYEFENQPTTITIPKPRTTETVSNRRIEVDYGYYFFGNGYFGNFATNQYSNVDLSLLNTGEANTLLNLGTAAPATADRHLNNTLTYSNTVIGNARIKLVSFYSVGANTFESNNYIYKVFVTDVNTKSIGPFSANTTGSNTNSVGLPLYFSSVNDVYKGCTIRVVSGSPFGEDNTRVIINYTGSPSGNGGGNASIDRPFSTAVTSAWRFIIDPKIGDMESVITKNTANQIVASINVSPISKDMTLGTAITPTISGRAEFQPTRLQDTKKEPLLIRVGEPNISDNSISDFSYSYRRLYQGVSFSAGISQILSVGPGETLQSASTESAKQQYYQVVVVSQGSSIYGSGQTVPSQAITNIDTASRTITISGGQNMTANIFAVVNASNPTSKTKRYLKANTRLVDPAWGVSSGTLYSVFGAGNTNVYIAPNDGQTIIASSLVQRKPGAAQTLYVSDVHSINAIFDLAGSTVTTAAYNSASNVTSRYTLINGQKDSYYDWSAITLKPGQTAPQGPLVVRYNRFTSNGSGFFSVDSYTRLDSQERGGSGIDYGDIPIFTSQDGKKYSLSDYLDFRPVRLDATTAAIANTFSLDVNESILGPQIAEPGLDIITDYAYYLPRIDRVVLNQTGRFEVLQGIPSSTPVVPVEPQKAMTLYVLNYPAYLKYTLGTGIQTFSHRRYTMKDIAKIDKRLTNLELYTSLSIAELSLINKNDKTVRDSVGGSRPKNGIFVDSFVDKSAAATVLPDFDAAIDTTNYLCRGSYNISSTTVFSNGSISGVEIAGPLMLLSSSNTTFVSQNRASTTININPFNIVNHVGTIRLDPPSDVWISNTRVESQNIDLTGGQEAIDAYEKMKFTEWAPWTSQVIGQEETLLKSTLTADVKGNARGMAAGFEASGGKVQGSGARAEKATVTYTQSNQYLVETETEYTREGTEYQVVPKKLTKTFGDVLIDVSVVQYMREKNILFVGERFKAFKTLYPFFDNVSVSDKVAKINRFKMIDNNLDYKTTIADSEVVDFYQVTSNTALQSTDTLIGTGKIVLTSNNNAFVASMSPNTSFGSWSQCATNGIWIQGRTSGKNYRAETWYHQSGKATAGGASTITLAQSVGGAINATDYVGQIITILYGTGKGQTATISSYDSSTRVATINGTWTTTPDSTSIYTIGNLETTQEGTCAGIFFLPDAQFRTGEKVFRLIDNNVNNIEQSETNGSVKFVSQGTVNTLQEKTVSVFVPTLNQSSVNEQYTVNSTSIKNDDKSWTQNNVVIGYYDPLAQNFLVNPTQYPQGIVIDSIRVCFKYKDTTVPVTCQIRPTVNGYPSASVIYPYAEKTLTPDKVKTTVVPDISDSNKYTEFKFDVPILLLPGEHSFVLVSNSNGYETFVGVKGQNDLKTGGNISETPYSGDFFKSQNGSTWKPINDTNIMFSIQKKVFSGTGSALFEVDTSPYSSNSVYDIFNLMSTDAKLLNTDIKYEFVSEPESGEGQPLLEVIPNIDYECTDGYGRRILSKTTGNTTFQLRTTLSTINSDISPMIDITRLNLLTIENRINNMPLKNTGFVITNTGSGYTTNGTVTFSYGSGVDSVLQGSGAAARAVTDGSNIIRVELTNAGTGYIASPTIAISGGGGTGATAIYNGEDQASGGNADVRYISKRIKLAPGFDAGDLRVYMDAYRPPGSGILVYYKLLSESDPSNFDENNYQLMTELSATTGITSKNKQDYFEVVFAPGTFSKGVPDNKIAYTPSNLAASPNLQPKRDFSMFSIKVVLYGSSTVDVPKFSKLRAIALPSG